jgi:hypothetical protein
MNKRIEEKNRIRFRINLIETYIATDQNTIERLIMSNTNYSNIQTEKITAKKSERLAEVNALRKRLLDVDKGLLDSELCQEYKVAKSEMERKTNDKIKKYNQEKNEKEQRSIKSQQYYQANRKNDRESNFKQKDMERTYKYYLRLCDSIPDYMTKKLNNMPNNKGYIWRGIYFYGNLPTEIGEPTVIFEKQKDLLIIHEWFNDGSYKIWNKKGKNRKVLYESGVRRKIDMGNNIMDYMK